jgi:hypothetical protein
MEELAARTSGVRRLKSDYEKNQIYTCDIFEI